ncbi:MAG: hypothetical protein RQ736_12415 [Thiogranum sp.]|nr:hypothetical protein [Thiogranum sp.]
MSDHVLDRLVAIITANPHSADSLGLYALVSTLRMEKTGYLYTLRKLRDLNDEHRQLAYELMELMAQNGNEGDAWEAALETMDAAVRRGTL